MSKSSHHKPSLKEIKAINPEQAHLDNQNLTENLDSEIKSTAPISDSRPIKMPAAKNKQSIQKNLNDFKKHTKIFLKKETN